MFDQLKDGVVLSRLLEDAKPGTLKTGAIVAPTADKPASVQDATKKANAAQVLRGAQDVGCDVADVRPEDIVTGNEAPVTHAVDELLRLKGLSDLPTKTGPEMDALLQPGETAADLRALPGEALAARWVNKHLGKAGVPPGGPINDPAVCQVQ
jgi:hypothetical protein